MPFYRLFPRALVACFALCLLAVNASAQEGMMRPRLATPTAATTTSTRADGSAQLENDPVIISLAEEETPGEVRRGGIHAAPELALPTVRAEMLNRMLLSAIEARLGTPYRLGATGPYRYDCSGFVWSVFQSAGVDFERMTARSLWNNFAPARDEEKFRFGTLVFFNNLKHVGIVADAGGFYHASTSNGVMYSPFSDYWLARLDGFRSVPAIALEQVATNR